MLYRAADGEPPKIVQAGKLGKIEILGKGQQFVAFGTHPSGAELEWFPEPPGAELRMGLPAVTEDQIHAFLEACAPIIEAESPKRANGQDHGAGEPEPIHSALPPRSPASRTAGRPTGNLGTRSAWPYSVRPAAARPGRQCSTPSQHPTPRTVAASARWEHYSTILPNLIGAGTIFHMAAEAKQRAPTEGDTPDPEILANPDMSVLRLGRRDPPAFPMEVLCKTWGNWAGTTADAAACPVDNVVAPLLASASALISHARWAQVTPGWMEPPHLWCGAVGDSGTGKSPGADTLLRDVLPELERRMLGDFPDRLAQWRIAAETHAVAAERWKAEVRTAGKSGTPPPLPPAADIPLGLSSIEPNDAGDEMDGSQEVPRGLLVAGSDCTKLLDLGEEVLNQMARRIKLSVIVARRRPVGSRRDDSGLARGRQRLKDARVGVERLVGDQRIGLHRGQQVVCSFQVVCLAAGQEEADRVAQCIDQGMYLGAQSAARSPDRLVLAGFFSAPALCWWARTMVLSIIAYSLSASAARC
jgi:hypothetical protein